MSLYNLDDGGYQIGVVLEVHIDGISEEEAQKLQKMRMNSALTPKQLEEISM